MQEITSRKNPLVQHMRRLGRERRYRDDTGQFLCDGRTLYREALAWGAEITAAAVSDRGLLEEITGEAILVPPELLAYISPMKTPQPILFVCGQRRMPGLEEAVPAPGPHTVLVLDGVQDPGNVGTLIRSAGAFSVDQVLLTGGCADLYNPKTVRGAMGALFRQPVRTVEVGALLSYLRAAHIPLFGAALGEGGVLAGEATLPDRIALAIGSEGGGLSASVLAGCQRRITIPMEPGCESLNAGIAGSILLWELYRRGRGEERHG